jgi:RNA polymerase sigma factor (sigma-70 family)
VLIEAWEIDEAADGMVVEPDDEELVKACLAGKKDAFAEIMKRYKGLVYHTIYSVVGDSSDKNDLFQEVFLKAFTSLRGYNAGFRFSTWIMRITTNTCIDRLRRRPPEGDIPGDSDDVGTSDPSPEEECLRKERIGRVRAALGELPEEYRIPVILFHQHGLSYEELTGILNQPLTVVKNRLYRARLMLREKLQTSAKEEDL